MRIDLDGIYAAVEDDCAFDDLADRVAEACGTRSALLIFLENRVATAVKANWWDQGSLTTYAEHFVHDDPWMTLSLNLGRFGRAAALDKAMSPKRFQRTAFYNDLIRQAGDDTGRCLSVAPLPGREGLMLGVHRAAGDAAFTAGDERRLDEVYDHVRRVVALRRTLAVERARGARLQNLVDQSGEAILHLDRNLRVVAISAAAERLLDKRDGIFLRDRRLVLPIGIETKLRAAAGAIIDRIAGARTALLCPRPSGRRPYRLRLLPAGFDGDAGVLLRVDDPDAAPGPDWQVALREAYGLSAMEADLASRLHADHSLEEIAGQRGVTRETLRTQLKSLFHKTGVTRQISLVRLLATFPAAPHGGNSGA
ncbi:helix-turn-helix transcriptional regulator [Sphingopyxis sp.]|uniref:helix-turn-helix transcriptional regulator n=1 Tax=Sphingopyxis sp. TaxID=1908224 RepID=UPI00260CB43B|nr:helix-turn-helix transcriptional regulator [Sphingopyxis sp.]MCW0199457.1 helix-turn-helix transcriptional regulator [Sphingopyxis sp.]